MSLTLTIQGWIYVLSGLWPVLHIKSFEMITGRKTDKWLVKTVGLMIFCSGVIFITYHQTEQAMILAIMNALVLAMVDIYYVVRKIIPRIYLADAAMELGFVSIYAILLLK